MANLPADVKKVISIVPDSDTQKNFVIFSGHTSDSETGVVISKLGILEVGINNSVGNDEIMDYLTVRKHTITVETEM